VILSISTSDRCMISCDVPCASKYYIGHKILRQWLFRRLLDYISYNQMGLISLEPKPTSFHKNVFMFIILYYIGYWKICRGGGKSMGANPGWAACPGLGPSKIRPPKFGSAQSQSLIPHSLVFLWLSCVFCWRHLPPPAARQDFWIDLSCLVGATPTPARQYIFLTDLRFVL
jgi:hypothetical protein